MTRFSNFNTSWLSFSKTRYSLSLPTERKFSTNYRNSFSITLGSFFPWFTIIGKVMFSICVCGDLAIKNSLSSSGSLKASEKYGFHEKYSKFEQRDGYSTWRILPWRDLLKTMYQIGDWLSLKRVDLLWYTVDDKLKPAHWILDPKKCETRPKISRRVTSYSQAGEKLVKAWVDFYRELPIDQVSWIRNWIV